ncbi:hypothetical protein ZIOFF_075438 [Zingiber officinale]|uniref:Ubiquitin carboxyl-terminal hydrolase n=1 Tax=Zingiber officinale TaxID=94328 RepID=A0A8J5ERH6_ZINOF|nr:hypothetical protein ZIOFF_075438 [Zingiber officinale]
MAEGASISVTAQLEALFHRRIEFHPNRKPLSSFPNGDFRLETLNPSSGPGTSAEKIGGVSMPSKENRSVESEFYEFGFDQELSCRITFRRIGAGLANLGNTCFLNSVLQCLTYTEPFAAYLQSGKHKSSCHTAGFCAMCALQNHVITALQSSGKIVSPSHLVKNLRCVSRSFQNSRQEDAHEYMVNLLESMHKCCLPSGVPSESPSAYEKSLVHKIFGGRLQSQVKCMRCNYSSNKFDPFLDLSLEIVKADSLLKALAHYTKVEQLDGGQKQYQCQNCKEKVKALKQLTIYKAPHVLTIHLKRFYSHDPGQKIDKKVEFEPSLDLKPFVSDQQGGNLKYTLYGVLVHAGWSTRSGHYYCYVRTSSGLWHSLDDNQVHQVSEKTVLAQKAYMLFYVRNRSSIPKGFENLFCKDRANQNGKKLIPQSSLVLNGVVQNGLTEKCHSPMEPTSSQLQISSAVAHSASAMNVSSNELSTQMLSPLLNGGTSKNKIPELQNNNQVLGVKLSTLKDGSSIKKGLQQTSAPFSKSPVKLPVEKVLKEVDEVSVAEKGLFQVAVENSFSDLPQNVDGEDERSHASCRPLQCAHQNGHSSNLQSEEDNAKQENLAPSVKMLKKLHNPMKLRRLAKYAQKGLPFGRSFLASLNLSVIQRSKKNKKFHLRLKDSQKHECVRQKDQALPTSGAVNNVSAGKGSSSKHSRSEMIKGSIDQAMKIRNYCNESFDHADKKEEVTEKDETLSPELPISSSNSTIKSLNSRLTVENEEVNGKDVIFAPQLPIISSNPTEKSVNSRVTFAGDQVRLQKDFRNMLMMGLEISVPRWDDAKLHKLSQNGLESSRSTSIGYVLDEWNEEYDRGKRKKLRKSLQSFDGPNLFQQTANQKARQNFKAKFETEQSANQPFRIFWLKHYSSKDLVECMSKPFFGENFLKVDLAVDAKFAESWYASKKQT